MVGPWTLLTPRGLKSPSSDYMQKRIMASRLMRSELLNLTFRNTKSLTIFTFIQGCIMVSSTIRALEFTTNRPQMMRGGEPSIGSENTCRLSPDVRLLRYRRVFLV